ncbi:MAG TPA: DUF2273 domain-containing protein [Thermoanaerobacterales bacterium]|jgi:uncharacterized membrane protein|nr:DUF2273 domain-containing protein [Thermoanaerobacterales bacterium]
MDSFFDNWQGNSGKIIGVLIGVIVGITILLFGFFKSIFIVFCAIIGYYIGKIVDNKESLRDVLDKILPPGR